MALPQELVLAGQKRNIMREIREYGLQRAAVIGTENVLDFSLGNPSVPPPPQVNETLKALLDDPAFANIHGYTSAQGDLSVRTALAQSLTHRFGMSYGAHNLYLTVGAAAGLTCTLKAMTLPGDEIVLLAPYFTEYPIFIEGCGGKVVVSPCDDATMLPDLNALTAAITPNTKAVLVNSPNNPSGLVYDTATLTAIADILTQKSTAYGHPIYLISDEPYRELVFEGFSVPWMPHIYKDTVVCYSYSKSLSLPGERIGYVLVGDDVTDSSDLYSALNAAGRILGYVNAPSIFQHVIAKLDGVTADLTVYQKNRDLLYHGLTGLGFTCIEPGGTFYLMVKSPDGNATSLYEKAKSVDVLMAPADDFGCPGWCRMAFCTETTVVEKAVARLATI